MARFKLIKVGAGFVTRIDVGVLIETWCFPVVTNSVPEAEIRDFWEALVWTSVAIPKQQIVLEGDAQEILTTFLNGERTCHRFLRDARLLGTYFFYICVQHNWRKDNISVDYTANKYIKLVWKAIRKESFPQHL